MEEEVYVKIKVLAMPTEDMQFVLPKQTTIGELKKIIEKQSQFKASVVTWKLLYIDRTLEDSETLGEIQRGPNIEQEEIKEPTINKLVLHLSWTEFTQSETSKPIHLEEQKAVRTYKLCLSDIMQIPRNQQNYIENMGKKSLKRKIARKKQQLAQQMLKMWNYCIHYP
eukprot:TRINITY_DN90170_c0_g1_i1.p3 TRINITY_DN90170_c0_g1~~TRINITY_DN90170_c0_g1_i1.p3  ORF type:complete len:191 (+),score=19.19 TRINITY_DN90170_c0_g1_i1:72-575(+)